VTAKIQSIAILAAAVAIAASAASPKTVMDGVYTTAQAGRGKTAYNLYCAGCHKEDLSGGADDAARASALKGDKIFARKELNTIVAALTTLPVSILWLILSRRTVFQVAPKSLSPMLKH
jgi:mono/diheme cytochrome c family protein